MTAFSPDARPTGSRVHRYTKTLVGDEGRWYQPVNRRNRGRIMHAAEQYDRVARLGHRAARNGKKIGDLGPLALEVLRLMLFRFHNHVTGRTDPAIATLAKATGHSIPGVHAALKRLRDHGFLAWLRRYRPTDRQGIRGPQVEQASNAYQILVPKAVARALAAPLPDDDTHRRQQAAADTRHMLDGLPLEELPGAIVSDSALAAVLARLGRAVEAAERGSNQANESQPR